MKKGNIFCRLPGVKNREMFEVLQKGKSFKIERIVSYGQTTPEDRWLCSTAAEWVMVLCGRARLLFKGGRKKLELKTGDYVFIPERVYHRVDWTHPGQKTVWLAVHIKQIKQN